MYVPAGKKTEQLELNHDHTLNQPLLLLPDLARFSEALLESGRQE